MLEATRPQPEARSVSRGSRGSLENEDATRRAFENVFCVVPGAKALRSQDMHRWLQAAGCSEVRPSRGRTFRGAH